MVGGVAKKERKKSFTDKEREIVKTFLEEKKKTGTVFSFTNEELRPLVKKLTEASGFERSSRSVRMYLVRWSGKTALPLPKKGAGSSRYLDKIQRYLNRVARCVKREVASINKEFRRKTSELEKEKEVLKKELAQLKEENQQLKEDLRSLKKVQAAVEEYQRVGAR